MNQLDLFGRPPAKPRKKPPTTAEARQREAAARAAKSRALARVTEAAGEYWKRAALEVFRGMAGEMTGEDIRLTCNAEGVTPHHPNAWGGFVAGLVKAGELEPTGRYRPMVSAEAHGRETKIYRKATP